MSQRPDTSPKDDNPPTLPDVLAEIEYWRAERNEGTRTGNTARVLKARENIGRLSQLARRLRMQEAQHAGD